MLRDSFLILIICWFKIVNSRLWIEGDIRLVGGPRRYMGTVVILHNGRWGAVCDDSWDITDATVVCRQLGYTMAVRATNQSEFGPGRKKLWLSEVRCNGTEERLDECPLRFYDENTQYKCSGRFRSAGAICSAALQKMTSKIKSSAMEITTEHEMRAKTGEQTENLISLTKLKALHSWSETEVPESMKIITSSRSTFEDTAPVTSTLTVKTSDFKQEMSTASKNVLTLATFKNSQLLTPYETPITSTTAKSLNVPGTYMFIDNYHNSPSNENATHQSINNQTAGDNSSRLLHQEMKGTIPLKCSMFNRNAEGCEDYVEDDPNVQNFEIRLKGGRYKWEGHLQIRINNKGSWGTVCSDHWTLTEAMVACNQLGDIGQAKQTLQTSYFGGVDVPKSVYKIQCVGRELTFDSCNVTWSDEDHSCSKNTAVAGVVCSQHLPDLVPNLRAVEESVRLQDQPLYYLRCAMEENCLASSAYTIRNTSLTWRNTMRRLLRFSTVVHNRGMADFRPYRPRGQWEWHACHMHYHSMEIFAHYDILDSNGTRLAEGSKASFCLEDTTCDKGVHPNYNCRGFADQGLSVNCSDNYMYDIDCQWIDISDLKPGDYTFLMEVNPTMLVAESNFDNNIVSCRLYYSGYFASVRDCHYESLLDYTNRDRQKQ